MSAAGLALVSLAGGLGAATRFVTDGVINERVRGAALPVGTLTINITGSFLLALLVGLAGRRSGLPPELTVAAGVGFCGGYTTFSTASVETVRLWIGDQRGWAITYALLSVVGSVLAAAVGLWFGGMGR